MVRMKLNFRLPGTNVGFANRSPIGLDVGARWVKAAQLRREGARWHLEAAARFPRLSQDVPADAREATRIEEVLSRQGFRGRDVVLAAPTEKLMTDLLDLPARTPATPFEQIMRAEVARIHRCDASKLEIAHWDVPASARTARGTQVLSVACQHADAEAVLDVFESVGLNVVALDARSVAVARACAPMLADVPQRVSAILMLDWNQASVVVMHQGIVVYERRLKDSGIRRLHHTIRTQLNLDAVAVDHVLDDVGLADAPVDDAPASSETVAQARALIEAHLNAIVQDLRASLTYASHQYPEASIERVLLVGEGTGIPGVDRQLAGRTGLEVRKASAVELVNSPDNLLSLCTPALTAAIGLASYQE